MTVHNSVLLAAAISGITAGVYDGQDFSQVTAASVAAGSSVSLRASVLVIATALDQAIPSDATLSVAATGVLYVLPFAGAGADTTLIPFFTKPLCLAGICQAAFKGRQPTSVNPADYATEVAGIAAVYAAAVTQLPTA